MREDCERVEEETRRGEGARRGGDRQGEVDGDDHRRAIGDAGGGERRFEGDGGVGRGGEGGEKTGEETAAKSALDEAKAAVKAAVTRVNDAARDRTREIFAESLAVCVTEDESIAPESLATIAGQIESAMSAKWPDGGKDFKAKVRQLSFNLRDAKNPDLRSSVASGEIAADVLIDLAPEELGSNERRKANEKIREHAEWEAVRGQQQQASTDAFKCGKCKQRKCTYYQLQTRSADEPMTSTFVFAFYFSPWRCFFLARAPVSSPPNATTDRRSARLLQRS